MCCVFILGRRMILANKMRILRGEEDTVVHEGKCASIRRHRQEVEVVGRNTECGIQLEGYSEFKPGTAPDILAPGYSSVSEAWMLVRCSSKYPKQVACEDIDFLSGILNIGLKINMVGS